MTAHPDRSEILERLRRLVLGKVNIDPEQLRPEAHLADIGIDSFSLIELVFLVEEEFQITIPLEGLVVTTVSDVLDLIERRLADARG
jgi:acyl carrier protein